jgi:hypothetical protein
MHPAQEGHKRESALNAGQLPFVFLPVVDGEALFLGPGFQF